MPFTGGDFGATQCSMNVLVWLQHDLRVNDHAALQEAAALGKVLPLYVVDPNDYSSPARAGRHWSFVAECLEDLRGALAGLGAPLVVRSGPPDVVLKRLFKLYQIDRIVTHRRMGADPSRAALRAWAEDNGLIWHDVPPNDCGPLGPLAPVADVAPGLIPTAKALGIAPDHAPHRQIGGGLVANALADSYAAARGLLVEPDPLSVIVGERSSSRLSPYLTHGVLSPTEVIARFRVASLPQGVVRSFTQRLARRAEIHRAAHRFDPPEPLVTPVAQAFAAGQTGLPLVDACLRSLRATGWINSAGRGMLASVGIHHLGLSEAQVHTALARMLTDYDPQIMGAALASVRTGRVADPLRLAEAQDPMGRFTRKWLPELAPVPDALLHRPWRWSGAGQVIGRKYPEALVDPAHALSRARDALALRRRLVQMPDHSFDVIEPAAPAALSWVGPRRGAQLALDL